MLVPSLLVVFLSQSPAVEGVKVYRGGDGQVVEVVTLAPRASKRAVVRFRGADSEHDGLALPCEVRAGSQGTDFVSRHGGSEWTVLSQREGRNTVYVPGRPEFAVKFDREGTDAAKAADVLAAHEAQLRDGRLAAFAKKPWPVLEAKYQGLADAAVRGLAKPCGRALTFRFDWPTFGDETMAELDVWKACAPLVSRLESSCALAKQATVLRCRLGAAHGLAVEGDALVFTTTAAGGTSARDFLAGQK